MASFLKSIAKRLGRSRQGALADRVRVAAFGKHPGWDDHMEDMGLQTETLLAAKRLIYVQGIGENIERGTWETLQEDRRLERFEHAFVWSRQGDTIAGRMWSSQDGRGRKSYPMVVCVDCCELPVDWICRRLLPQFDAVEAECKRVPTAAGVHASLAAFQSQLRGQVKTQSQNPPSSVRVSQALAAVAGLPEMGPGDQALMRILYHLDREAASSAGDKAGKNDESDRVFLRVPVSAERAAEAMILWLGFLQARFGKLASVVAFVPRGRTWLDLVVGQPTPGQLYCLRALPEAVPLTSDIPYNISPEFVEQARRLLAE